MFWRPLGVGGAKVKAGAMAEDSPSLEARIRRLEDIEEINRLKVLYCYYADSKDSTKWCEVFTEDGVFETDFGPATVGKDAIRQHTHGSFAIHFAMNPLIEIDGDKATGRWLLLMPCTFDLDTGKRPVWAGLRYENDLVRTAQGWRFSRVRLFSLMWTPYDTGWEVERFVPERQDRRDISVWPDNLNPRFIAELHRTTA